MKQAIRFITIFFALVTIVALLAHLFELPAKMRLNRQDYRVVQGIYSGWSLLGVFEIGAIVLTGVWLLKEYRVNKKIYLVGYGFLLFVISLVIFFIYTFPANTITHNWTSLPDNWEVLRRNWEYSHAVRALLNLTGFFLLIIAISGGAGIKRYK